MKLLFQNFQVNFFTNNQDVAATPPVLSMLLTKLSSLSLLPMFGQELNAITGEKRPMVIMTDAEQSFRIEFHSHSVIFNAAGGTADEFLSKIESAFDSLQSVFPDKKSNRLAFLHSKIYQGSSEEYLALYKDLFTFHKANPIEWENRVVERFNSSNSDEIFNLVSTVRRATVQSPMFSNGNLTDIINFETDVNTIPETTHFRFDFRSSVSRINELVNKNKEMMSELSRYTDK
ncbi:hypothetical protein [Klebsiella variicola]|uniref:hypothetical protein n=1 Tax=Klebsiella variicola TaxID=244366 RepID=UPI001083377D|nr:hypothetical protein [Klebsiella variicola]VFZ87145.1 Uncharacterised protein [Klebsiella variicola]